MGTFYENIILNSISLDAYDIENGTEFDNIQNVYKIFVSEYGYNIPRVGELNSFKEWLQGLPSVLTVPFYNSEILDIAYIHGVLDAKANEATEDGFLNTYFDRLASAFFTLKDNL
jgi:hypothetical protein